MSSCVVCWTTRRWKKWRTRCSAADVGVDATEHLLDGLRVRWKRAGANADPRETLAEAMIDLIAPLEQPLVIGPQRPFVIMLTGVNGAGKTTSIGKLAKWLQSQNLSVLLAAGDTFRAAAREQLIVWGERNGVAVIQQAGGDPAAVMFDAVAAARARGIDVVLADTAGRLPTQAHLMEELRKVKRVLGKAEAGAPHEVMLVLDANTGQNALAQVRAFDEAVGLTGLIVTKLDGSAKGGVVAAIAKQHPVPLRVHRRGRGGRRPAAVRRARVRRRAAASHRPDASGTRRRKVRANPLREIVAVARRARNLGDVRAPAQFVETQRRIHQSGVVEVAVDQAVEHVADVESAGPARDVRIADDVDGAAVAEQVVPLRPAS